MAMEARSTDVIQKSAGRGPGGRMLSAVPTPEAAKPSLFWRLLFVFVGFTLASLGFGLVMSVFLAFIGLPLFVVGAALMQAQESRYL